MGGPSGRRVPSSHDPKALFVERFDALYLCQKVEPWTPWTFRTAEYEANLMDELKDFDGRAEPSKSHFKSLVSDEGLTSKNESSTVNLSLPLRNAEISGNSPAAHLAESNFVPECSPSLENGSYSSCSDEVSSARSADYTVTSAEPNDGLVLSPLRRALIDRVMEKFHSIYDSTLSLMSTNREDVPQGSRIFGTQCTGSHKQTANTPGQNHDSSSSSIELQNSQGRRSTSHNTSPSGHGTKKDDDIDNRSEVITKARVSKVKTKRRYACHFHQHDPIRYSSNEDTGSKHRTCAGPGWESVHRIKEHLYRCHVVPIQCGRCYASFETKNELNSHFRADIRCEKSEETGLEGIDEDTIRQLRRRKRVPGVNNEDDKWREVYRICFPGELVPSPYYNDNPIHSPSISEYDNFARNELPRMVRSKLETVASEEMRPLEDELKRRLVDIIAECQQSISDIWKAAPRPRRSPRSNTTRIESSTSSSIPDESHDVIADAIVEKISSQRHQTTSESTNTGPSKLAYILPHSISETIPLIPSPTLDNDASLTIPNTFIAPSDSGYASGQPVPKACTCDFYNDSGSTSFDQIPQPQNHDLDDSDDFSQNEPQAPISDSSAVHSFGEGTNQFDFTFSRCPHCGGRPEWMDFCDF